VKGFRKEHVRFFLIYESYRKRLNFTFKKLAKTSQKLDAFKNMVQDLQKADNASSSEKAKALANSIISVFERNMNEDLYVKAAFNELYATVVKLHKLMGQRKLGAEDVDKALMSLRRVDSVLQVIF
jgi:cysteinyl-tRNA synthetase